MRAIICYNPYSGRQDFESNLDYITTRLKTKYEQVDIFRSLYSGSITTFIINFCENYDLLIVSGGDGSLNEAVNGVMKLEHKPKLAYIPSGTVNDVGHMLELNKSIEKSLDIILEDKIALLDICKMDDKYFVYASAAGSFSNVSYKASSKLKRKIGKLAYFYEAFKEFKLDETFNLEIKLEDKTIVGSYYLFLILNSHRLAGFRIHRRIKPKLNDGIIDLTLISKSSYKLSVFKLIFFFIFGEKYKYGIDSIRTSKFSILCDKKMDVNVDGEFAFQKEEINVEVLKEQLEIIVTNKIKRKYF